MKYDAIIAGASFAGLSVAGRLRGRVLLIDKREIGMGQTSACATFLSLLENLGCLESVLEEHHDIYVHTASRRIRYHLPQPFCTFDYHAFCRSLADRCDFDWVQAEVIGINGDTVVTNKGSFSGRCLVDASGWRSILSTGPSRVGMSESGKSFGIEYLSSRREKGLHFIFDPRTTTKGYGWIFPIGEQSRIGICSYRRTLNMKSRLQYFGSEAGSISGVHGGYLTSRIRRATDGNLFIVGDAAGHCLPVTGEGIRTAVYFGERCGEYVQKVISGELNLASALSAYQAFVNKHRSDFIRKRLFQKWLEIIPNSWLTRIALRSEKNFDKFFQRYTDLADPRTLKGPLINNHR